MRRIVTGCGIFRKFEVAERGRCPQFLELKAKKLSISVSTETIRYVNMPIIKSIEKWESD